MMVYKTVKLNVKACVNVLKTVYVDKNVLRVQKYYGGRLESSGDLQTSAASCSLSCCPVPRSVTVALSLVHPEVNKRYSSRVFSHIHITPTFFMYIFNCIAGRLGGNKRTDALKITQTGHLQITRTLQPFLLM